MGHKQKKQLIEILHLTPRKTHGFAGTPSFRMTVIFCNTKKASNDAFFVFVYFLFKVTVLVLTELPYLSVITQ